MKTYASLSILTVLAAANVGCTDGRRVSMIAHRRHLAETVPDVRKNRPKDRKPLQEPRPQAL
jgi:hypothetical protein